MKPLCPVILAVLALMFLIPPSVLWTTWVQVASDNPDSTRAERSALYIDRFNALTGNPVLIAISGLVCCIISIVLSAASIRDPRTALRVINGLLILCGSVMMFLTFVPLI